MCGIAGIVGTCRSGDPARVLRASEKLRHRGPDDAGYLCYTSGVPHLSKELLLEAASATAILVHRRLSILDLTRSGWQPMGTGDGRYFVVFNGEIYNFIELRRELEQLGHRFHTRSDTEVLLAAYAQWGTAALLRFTGMFAFALLDTEKEELLLARDFFGIKPLYYAVDGARLAFASEVKSLLELGVKPVADPQRAYGYLQRGICDYGDTTFIAGISQLPAGHYLVVQLGQPTTPDLVRYWEPKVGERYDISFEEAAQRTRDMFQRNIELHLRSDVPVGVALSGGIDSSAIAAAMRHVRPGLELHAFTYVADDAEVSEEQWSEVAAQSCKAVHHKVRPSASDLASELECLTYAQDHPFGSTSIYAQFCVFRAASEAGVTVMLDGQGADEMFAGYRFFMAARFASLIRQGKIAEAIRFARRCEKWPGVSARWIAMRAMEYLLPAALHGVGRKLAGKDPAPHWMNQKWFADRAIRSDSGAPFHTAEILHGALRQCLTHNTLPGLLRYEDRNSMAFSVESRVPFLTPDFVQFALSLAESYIVGDDGTSKRVFREAMRGLVPDVILDRRDKVGFATPERQWLRRLHPLVTRLLASDAARIPCLDLRQARAEWDAIVSGKRTFNAPVWRWINLIAWTQRYEVSWT